MVHGAPDNFEVQPKDITFRLDDMAELAVRLGSPDLFHKLGDVIFIDSFENGLGKWGFETADAIHTVKLSGDKYKTGGFSCKLLNLAIIEADCGGACGSSFFQGGKIGFEYSFAGDQYGKMIKISIGIYDGDNLITGEVLLNIINKTLSYYKDETEFKVFETGLKVVQNEYDWNTWKLIVDIDKKEYIKLILNQYIYSLSGIKLHSIPYESAPFISVRFYMQQTQDVDTTLYIDDCILTQNEP